jgi:hypothetical protein
MAIIGEGEQEYHVVYEGHVTKESAQTEMDEITKRLISDGKLPLPYYIYESDVPMHGYDSYHLDDLDFNFYRDPSEEEDAAMAEFTKQLEEAIVEGNEEKIKEITEKMKSVRS